MTFAADEPQAVLGLSWAALAFSSAGVLVSGQTMKRLMRRLDELAEQ